MLKESHVRQKMVLTRVYKWGLFSPHKSVL